MVCVHVKHYKINYIHPLKRGSIGLIYDMYFITLSNRTFKKPSINGNHSYFAIVLINAIIADDVFSKLLVWTRIFSEEISKRIPLLILRS